jgi:glycosyltransferase involved in cell wall biosynthesis
MKKLFVCSEFYAGLLPFGANIVNAMYDKDTFGIFVCTPKCDYRKTIIANGENYIFLDFPQSRIKGLLHNIYPGELIRTIENVCKKNDIKIVHLLTEDSSLALYVYKFKKQAEIYYTVHDLFFHEKVYKNFPSWLLRTILVKLRVTYLIKNVRNLVTCSQFQYQWMLDHMADKNIYFHNFPTLITKTICSGNAAIPELQGVENYILFFGQIEQYKGVDILYNTFINNPERVKDKILVIAGKGHIYFERNLEKEHNVIFINRYIDDEEIKPLFSNAFCVVFPYISGTQSGILSLPYYLKIPAIVSDIPFFQSMLIDRVTGMTFDLNNPASILQKIDDLDPETVKKIVEEGYLYYQNFYDEEALKGQLLQLYK